jgi:L-malate glycosyltransferase
MFVLCYWPARLAGVRRFVVTEHTDQHVTANPRLLAAARRSARRMTILTAIHASLRESLRDLLLVSDERVRLLSNGVDTEVYAPASKDLRLRAILGGQGAEPLIGCVGRLHPDKDHANLLHAFTELRVRCPSRLVLIGDGSGRERLEALVDALGIGEFVTLLGDRSDVPCLMPQLDLLVLPSRTEGLPMVLLEAMACGVPCVGTAVGAIPQLLADGAGLVVPPEDPKALAAALSRVLSDRALAESVAKAGRRRVLADYELQGVVDAYLRVFQEVCA